MVRPKIERRIGCQARFSCYKPNGVRLSELTQVALLPDELEALRLADKDGMSQDEASRCMGISRQTFGNIVKRARTKVATCLVEGYALTFAQKSQDLSD